MSLTFPSLSYSTFLHLSLLLCVFTLIALLQLLQSFPPPIPPPQFPCSLPCEFSCASPDFMFLCIFMFACYLPDHCIHIVPCLYRLSSVLSSFKFSMFFSVFSFLLPAIIHGLPRSLFICLFISISLLIHNYYYFLIFRMMYPQHVRCQCNSNSGICPQVLIFSISRQNSQYHLPSIFLPFCGCYRLSQLFSQVHVASPSINCLS